MPRFDLTTETTRTPADAIEAARAAIRKMTPEAFAALGLEQVAYIRPVTTPSGVMVGVFSASGERVALMADSAAAVGAIIQHEMIPASVH
ncbi:hypothetical protein GCM10011505_40320 [Tistrella bauzanensis]|uniref:DUF1150 domain-containing protein n=1 Tax=Tistrella bauzanensis TaxID=657419 RepID=A0ABQ1IY36_9PROT|nr:DUF1150 family protein [Tistrella bauzanensis]GGB55284.1 hypothetical protein GCM10011505_40320 [Tistrella bauzanensis]